MQYALYRFFFFFFNYFFSSKKLEKISFGPHIIRVQPSSYEKTLRGQPMCVHKVSLKKLSLKSHLSF
jgi:hypothetical protein